MFLSKLVLNIRDRQARRDLARPYELHRTLMNAYGRPRVANRCDLLFRVEPSRWGPSAVLVQTAEDPAQWSRLPSNYLLQPAESKRLDLRFTAGQRLRFRLRANPTKRVAAKNETFGNTLAGKRIGLLTDADRVRWLLHKGEVRLLPEERGKIGGFTIPGQWVDVKQPRIGQEIQLPRFQVDAVSEGRDGNGKPGHQGGFIAVRFDGVLVVTDPEAFRMTVATGIGSAKAFGFGLLSLTRTEA